ncbi:alpha/beta fold hydrolase [Gordonia neofelifaecis]|uniref:Alpha/beta hydrolase fold protein n=1 Tax=Gordonia neofelifaecis NRRL B-59395 TaxID=644548 RepID=F1YEI3_9ACTN|nr:alpha/beta fold hydrolase [Gordonia neofelifaecis]EGD56816.1 alpha/beta hydrolase fold protein [Gordonia neofelifaecis NRRL B-59395]
MPTFTVPGADLDVEFSDERGHPVVQLHGLTSSRSRDRTLGLDLGRGLSGTRLLRYDARAHGRSTGRPLPDDHRWPVLADDLLRLLDAWFPGERVHGVGPSMGTGTLLHAAVLDPGRFAGLTLVIPPTAWGTRPAMAEVYRTAADAVEDHGIEAFIAAGRDVPQPPALAGARETEPDVRADLLPSVLRGAALSDFPSPEQVARIDVPTSILAWVDDAGHPLSTAEALVDLLPSATLTVARTPAELALWPAMLHEQVTEHGDAER